MPNVSREVREEQERLLHQGLRRCSGCSEIKSLDCFSISKQLKSGRMSRCRQCHAAAKSSRSEHNRSKWETSDSSPYANPTPKRCAYCKQDRPRADFTTAPSRTDGLGDLCKGCAPGVFAAVIQTRRDKWAVQDPYAASHPKACQVCARSLPRTSFARSRTASDGLHGVCWECASRRSAQTLAANREHWATHDPRASPDPKRCPRCCQSRPREDFSTCPSNRDGLNSYCRGCSSAWESARRARVLDQWVENVDRSRAWDLAGGICYLCSLPCNPNRWDLDHVDPIVNGGEHSYFNTAPTHPSCNYSKGGTPWPDVSWPEGDEILARLSA